MPPRKSQRNKRPTPQALEALVATPPRRRRRLNDTTGSNPDPPPSAVVASNTGSSLSLPEGFLEELVDKVAAAVTKKLQPTNLASSSILEDTPLAQISTEFPVENTAADGIVLQEIQAVHSSLAGEGSQLPTWSARPSQIFTSISMPVDARVPAKLKSKIWQEEYNDFGYLLN